MRGIELAVHLAAGPTVLAYLLFAHGLRRLTASETTTIVLAEPVTASILGVAVLRPPGTQLGEEALSAAYDVGARRTAHSGCVVSRLVMSPNAASDRRSLP
jgi:DME family drug/metabolite transporter